MTAPMAPQRGPAFLDTVFGGGTPQSNDPMAQHRAQQQGLINAGVTLASHRGPGALAAALGAGQKAYAEQQQASAFEAQQQLALQTRQLLQETLMESGNDPESLVTLARRVMAYGDIDGAKAVLEMAKLQGSLKLNLRTQVMGDAKTGYKLINLDTGEIIRDYGMNQAAAALTPIEQMEASDKWIKNYQGVIQGQGLDEQAIFIKQLRNVTPGALRGDSQSQDAFLKALIRIENPLITRGVNDEQLLSLADQKGLLTGRIGEAYKRIMEGNLPGSAIADWLPAINQIIKGRIGVFDGHKKFYGDRAEEFGLSRNIIYDYFAEERYSNIPGVAPSTGQRLQKIFNEPDR